MRYSTDHHMFERAKKRLAEMGMITIDGDVVTVSR
jgi:hypothetical protein